MHGRYFRAESSFSRWPKWDTDVFLPPVWSIVLSWCTHLSQNMDVSSSRNYVFFYFFYFFFLNFFKNFNFNFYNFFFCGVRRKGVGLCRYMGNGCLYGITCFPPSLLGFFGGLKLNTPYYWNSTVSSCHIIASSKQRFLNPICKGGLN